MPKLKSNNLCDIFLQFNKRAVRRHKNDARFDQLVNNETVSSKHILIFIHIGYNRKLDFLNCENHVHLQKHISYVLGYYTYLCICVHLAGLNNTL